MQSRDRTTTTVIETLDIEDAYQRTKVQLGGIKAPHATRRLTVAQVEEERAAHANTVI